jgi:hypothetical protein
MDTLLVYDFGTTRYLPAIPQPHIRAKRQGQITLADLPFKQLMTLLNVHYNQECYKTSFIRLLGTNIIRR